MAITPAAYVTITLSTTDSQVFAASKLAPISTSTSPAPGPSARLGLERVAKYIERLAHGFCDGAAVVMVQSTTGFAAATGTVACVVATPPSDGDTCVIGGVTFTFKTSPAYSDPLQVAIGADGSASMTNLNAAVALNPMLRQLMTGVISGTTTKTITFTAVIKGTWGNSITITRTGTALTVAAFSGGADGTVTPTQTTGGLAVYNAGA